MAGNRKLLDEFHVTISPELEEEAAKMAGNGQTVVWFADGKEALAVTGITDRIKASARQAVNEWQAMGIEVYMLTGDHAATAAHIAKEAGIRHYVAGVLPHEKAGFTVT